METLETTRKLLLEALSSTEEKIAYNKKQAKILEVTRSSLLNMLENLED